MDQNEARAIFGTVFSRGAGLWVTSIFLALFVLFHLFVAGFEMTDLAYCNVSPARLQLFQIFGPVLAFVLFIGLRAAIPGKTQIPRIVALSLIAVIVGINLWYYFSRASVVWASDLPQTSFCKFAQEILPFERSRWGR
ncbi:hypothetical protein AB7828_30775 [Tardiphaga sp. 215_C5_N2_1]|uniref:hypothetical protein n=1 Tax=Tardiphaga sp. 215_C5_N2_1 TaxID=3240774 RepID=UPI003F88A0CD